MSDFKNDNFFKDLRDSEPYFDADDFVDNVMAALPAEQGLSTRMQNLLILLATALGSALTIYLVKDAVALPNISLQIGAISNLWQAGLALGAYAGMLGFCVGLIWLLRREWA